MIVADCGPVAVGMKLTATVHVPCAAKEPAIGQVPLLTITKSLGLVPPIEIPPILREATDELLTVIVFVGLLAPLAWLPRSRVFVERLTDGCGAKIVTVAVLLDNTPSLTEKTKVSMEENPVGGVYVTVPAMGSKAPREPREGPLTRT
jgi:hypothetical protein